MTNFNFTEKTDGVAVSISFNPCLLDLDKERNESIVINQRDILLGALIELNIEINSHLDDHRIYLNGYRCDMTVEEFLRTNAKELERSFFLHVKNDLDSATFREREKLSKIIRTVIFLLRKVHKRFRKEMIEFLSSVYPEYSYHYFAEQLYLSAFHEIHLEVALDELNTKLLVSYPTYTFLRWLLKGFHNLQKQNSSLIELERQMEEVNKKIETLKKMGVEPQEIELVEMVVDYIKKYSEECRT